MKGSQTNQLIETKVRVMDCFLFEGRKVMYRVWMAILILFHRHLNSLSPNNRMTIVSETLYSNTQLHWMFYRTVVEQRLDRRVGIVGLLSEFALQPWKVTKDSLWSAEFQLIRNGSVIRQDGNVSQIESRSIRIGAQQQERHGAAFSFQRRPTYQPVSSEHPDDVSHADNSRGNHIAFANTFSLGRLAFSGGGSDVNTLVPILSSSPSSAKWVGIGFANRVPDHRVLGLAPWDCSRFRAYVPLRPTTNAWVILPSGSIL